MRGSFASVSPRCYLLPVTLGTRDDLVIGNPRIDKPRGTGRVGRRAPRPSAPAILQQINSSRLVTSGDSAPRLCEAFFHRSLRGVGRYLGFGHPRGYAAPNWVARAHGTRYVKHSRRATACALAEMRARHIIQHLHKP